MQSINVDALVAEQGVHRPASAMTIAGTTTEPVMILAVASFAATSYVIAVDLVTEELLWKVPIADTPAQHPAGQFPLLTNGIDIRTVFALRTGGARAVGLLTE